MKNYIPQLEFGKREKHELEAGILESPSPIYKN